MLVDQAEEFAIAKFDVRLKGCYEQYFDLKRIGKLP